MAEWIEVKIEPADGGYSNVHPDMAPALKTEPHVTDIKITVESSVENNPLYVSGGDVYSDVKNEPADADDVGSSEVASSAEPTGAEGSPADATVKQEMDIGPTRLQPPDIYFSLRPCKSKLGEGNPSKIHRLDKQRLEYLSERTDARQYQCDLCLKTLKRKYDLQTHMLIHTGGRSHRCKICQKTCRSKGNLKGHMLTHAGARPYSCNICPKSFALKTTLNRHALVHTGDRPHSCNICKKSFALITTLKKHVSTHTGARLHNCNICPRSFVLKSALRIHNMSAHPGTWPYICNICQKTCTGKFTLKMHLLTHTGVRPYSCNICEKSYCRKDALKRHTLIHSGEQP